MSRATDPPDEVWVVRYRWANQQAAGKAEQVFTDRERCEDWLFAAFMSQYTPGDILGVEAILHFDGATWRQYNYSVEALLVPRPQVTTVEPPETDIVHRSRTFGQVPERADDNPGGEPPMGVAIPPDQWLPKGDT